MNSAIALESLRVRRSCRSLALHYLSALSQLTLDTLDASKRLHLRRFIVKLLLEKRTLLAGQRSNASAHAAMRPRGKIAVVISHRFSTVRMATQILVLERGRLVQQGTHAELLACGGLYAELFNLQAAGYRVRIHSGPTSFHTTQSTVVTRP